jgi:hypothetical protein
MIDSIALLIKKKKKKKKIDSIAFVISTIKQNATENELHEKKAVTKTHGSNYLTYKYLVSTFNS